MRAFAYAKDVTGMDTRNPEEKTHHFYKFNVIFWVKIEEKVPPKSIVHMNNFEVMFSEIDVERL